MVIGSWRNIIPTSFENPGVLRAGRCPNKAYGTLDRRTCEVSTRARRCGMYTTARDQRIPSENRAKNKRRDKSNHRTLLVIQFYIQCQPNLAPARTRDSVGCTSPFLQFRGFCSSAATPLLE